MSAFFCCPLCKGPLLPGSKTFQCPPCDRSFEIIAGIPDFFVSESDHDFSSDPNIIWLDSQIVEARDTVYRLCTRELQGMIFCMHAIGQRTGSGCRILEVGTGTGHFTRWLAEVSAPGTAIYTFDFSWPIIEKAKIKTKELSNVTIFRANAREQLPFRTGIFDIVLARLAPLGPHGVSNIEAAFELLKPGGWYFGAGWEHERHETSPIELAFQHGYKNAEFHEWGYHRLQSEEERIASETELSQLIAMFEKKKPVPRSVKASLASMPDQESGKPTLKMMQEHVLIAQKSK